MELTKNDENKRFLIKFKSQVYDISEFAHKHPGGQNTLNGLQGMDMESRFSKAPPHSDAAMYLLQEYKINDSQINGSIGNQLIIRNLKEATDGHIKNDIQSDLNDEFFNQTDDSLEVSIFIWCYKMCIDIH